MKKNLKKIIYIPISIILIGVVFILGTYVGYNHRPEVEKVFSLVNKEKQVETTADFEPFWKAWNLLNEKSIYAKDVTDQERVWGAIEGLASSLGDPYTEFFPPEESKIFEEDIEGSFEGIGAEIAMKDGILTVVAPLKDTPAWKAGLKSGDKIIKIDDTFTDEINIDEAIGLMRGPKGTNVTLTILRTDESRTKEIIVTRDNIEIPIIETELRDDNIFVIKFYSFSKNSTSLFRQALLEFIESKSNRLILDLRNNPGGYLEAAVKISSWFIDEGKTIVSEGFENNKEGKVYRSVGPKLFNDKLSMVILINEGSASASEILAGAFKYYKVATLIGENTFGKGSVQELVSITDDTSLKITISKWLLPDGEPISEEGLKPDIEVPLTREDYEKGLDPQMDKAVEFLNKN